MTKVKAGALEDAEKYWLKNGPTAPEEWNFEAVPENELIPCCYWEYARESHTIMLMAEVNWCETRHRRYREAYEKQPELQAQHDEHEQRVVQWVEDAGVAFTASRDEYWNTDLPHVDCCDSIICLARDGAKPWQRLSPEVKRNLTTEQNESLLLRPLAPAMVGELEELWNHNAADLMEVRSPLSDADDESEEIALLAQSESIAPQCSEAKINLEKRTVAFTVDFSRFTDNEITAAFQKWLKENRPEVWKKPRRVFPGSLQKGRKLLEYRVALERLGLMRLLHWHSPATLAAELPEAWEKVRRKEPDFRREVRLSSQFMHSLFPFLPKQERPYSEERYGVWMPEMQRIADEVEREMEAEGAANEG